MKHVIRPTAKDDIIRQFRYYLLADAFDTATRFLEAVDASIETILAMPEIGEVKICRILDWKVSVAGL